MVQRLDMHLRDLDELIVGKISEQHVARKGEIRTVNLQIKPGVGDRLVLITHGICEGGEIILARGVVGILQK